MVAASPVILDRTLLLLCMVYNFSDLHPSDIQWSAFTGELSLQHVNGSLITLPKDYGRLTWRSKCSELILEHIDTRHGDDGLDRVRLIHGGNQDDDLDRARPIHDGLDRVSPGFDRLRPIHVGDHQLAQGQDSRIHVGNLGHIAQSDEHGQDIIGQEENVQHDGLGTQDVKNAIAILYDNLIMTFKQEKFVEHILEGICLCIFIISFVCAVMTFNYYSQSKIEKTLESKMNDWEKTLENKMNDCQTNMNVNFSKWERNVNVRLGSLQRNMNMTMRQSLTLDRMFRREGSRMSAHVHVPSDNPFEEET